MSRRPPGLALADVLAYFGVPLNGIAAGPCVRPIRIRRTQKNGYWSVRWDGRNSNLHRMILEWKLGEAPPTRTLACHDCDHKWCVNPGHIRADSDAGNMADQYIHGRRVMGERHPQCRIPDADVEAIRSAPSSIPNAALAERFGITAKYVAQLKRGERRTARAA